MRGAPGSAVVLTIVRGSEAPRDVRLTRAIIRVPSVQPRWLDEGLAYLRIAQFQSETARQVQSAIEGLRRERPLVGLVLDLRGNPGGLLEAAVAVADQLLDSGLIVYTEGRAANAALRFEAGPGDLLDGAPLVVMIDDGSASAAEILAGALQDHRRALVVGRRSFGKGSVQSILPLDNGDGIKLTTALYYTPSGRSIQAEGIVPDVPLAAVAVRPEEPQRATTEADLSGHLDNAQSAASPARAAGAPLIGEDYAVQEALYMLKALVAFRR
jgi:carboxyl-terminal processing protease